MSAEREVMEAAVEAEVMEGGLKLREQEVQEVLAALGEEAELVEMEGWLELMEEGMVVMVQQEVMVEEVELEGLLVEV